MRKSNPEGHMCLETKAQALVNSHLGCSNVSNRLSHRNLAEAIYLARFFVHLPQKLHKQNLKPFEPTEKLLALQVLKQRMAESASSAESKVLKATANWFTQKLHFQELK